MNLFQSFGSTLISPVLRRLGYIPKARPFSDYIAFKETLNGAAAAGLSVGEYIEQKNLTGTPSALDKTMDGLAALGVFDGPIERVCEVGPGSGRYLEKTIARCKPHTYEIYETSPEWRGWLIEKYGVVPKHCDGRTLAETESSSVGLIQAHKVFHGLPLLVTLSYLREFARVVRDGGWVVFDIMTEKCFSKEHLDQWFEANPWEWPWAPHMCAFDFAIDLFAAQGIQLVGSFQIRNYPAVTECIVLRKTKSDPGVGAE
jgi:SAM-dependent methyltransferase